MKRYYIVLVVALWVAKPVCAQTAAQWRADLRMLSSALTTVHPEPFHDTAPETFRAAVRSLDVNAAKLTQNQILVRMLGIVAMLKDAHTQLHIPPTNRFPVRLYKFGDGIFVTGVRAEDASRLGAEVITINGKMAAAVYDSVQTIAAGDNPFSRMEAVPRFISDPRIINGLGLGDTTAIRLELKLKDGTRTEWTVSRSSDAPTLFERTDAGLYQLRRDGDMLYVKFNAVQDSVVAYARRIVAIIDSSSIDKLVIDLRDNGGGNNDFAKTAVTIIARSRINERGHLFVITGRRTYSAAMNFTSLLEDQTRAIFVGEAPGGSPHHYGDATLFTLPNSKMNFTVSTLHWSLGVQPMDVRITMEPDIAAPPRHDDVVNGKDAALDSIRSYTPNRPYGSSVQQMLKAAWASIPNAKGRAEIFATFKAVTDAYPNSHEAWFDRARVYAFVRDWKGAAESLRRASALRPQNALIKRMLAAAELREVT
ncbi:MAG TPA: hypothetical protein VM100_03835 [Longimicrobiales bacterium]|nr:hypothetical protein [Longimicrobiales bacterium]